MRLANPVTTALVAIAAALALGGVIMPAQGRTKGKPPVREAPPATGGKSSAAHEEIAGRPELAAKLAPLLPAGSPVAAASAGFKNIGQFVAAVHVAHNLGIPFPQLKARLIGARPEPLGQAVADLKPGVHADAEVAKALAQAKDDMR